MIEFASLYERAATRKGGVAALEAMIPRPRAARTLAKIPDDRWLAGMAKTVFRAGFNWKVVENKWPRIEEAFGHFDPVVVAHYPDEKIDELLGDGRVIRHYRKLMAIRDNAHYVMDVAAEHGSAGKYFGHFPSKNYVALLADLKDRGKLLGGMTAQYFLRELGKDSFILTRDVVAALAREKVFTGSPTSKSSLAAIQAAFNEWVDGGGQSLTRVSRVLAYTVE